MIKKKIKILFTIFTIILSSTALSFLCIPKTYAADLTATSVQLNNYYTHNQNTTYTIAAVTATTANIKRINIQFSTVSRGTTRPTNLDLSNTNLNSTSNLGDNNWQIGLTNQIYGLITIDRSSAIEVINNTSFSIELGGITNSAINDCESSNDTLTDTCHIAITTFSDNGSTAIDTGYTTFTLIENPICEFSISSVSANTTQNLITTSKASEITLLDFGLLEEDKPIYLSQKISLRTNAPHGYKVYLVLQDKFFGTAYNNTEIDYFGATDATWENPKAWENPDGTTPNQNTGWLGVNTSDGSVGNWSGGGGKFAPPSTSKRLLAQSDTPQLTTKEFYVSFVVGTNALQPGDQYKTNLSYQVEPIY